MRQLCLSSCKDLCRTLPFTEDPLAMKEAQSNAMLVSDSSKASRLRAVTLAQFFSISRFDEIRRWRISDCHPFRYSAALMHGKCDIHVLYIRQFTHKSNDVSYAHSCLRSRCLFKGSRPADERLIVRHVNWLICPCFAIAMYMYERFVIRNEEAPDLMSHPSNW